jgi:hypothetical protein
MSRVWRGEGLENELHPAPAVLLPGGGGVAGVPMPPDPVMPRCVADAAVHEAEGDVRGRAGVVGLGAGQAGRRCGQHERGGGDERHGRAGGEGYA